MASIQTPDLNEITSTKSTGGPWRVVLWDDNEHTYEYVIEMLVEICMMTVEKSVLTRSSSRSRKAYGRFFRRVRTRGTCSRKNSHLRSRSENV